MKCLSEKFQKILQKTFKCRQILYNFSILALMCAVERPSVGRRLVVYQKKNIRENAGICAIIRIFATENTNYKN